MGLTTSIYRQLLHRNAVCRAVDGLPLVAPSGLRMTWPQHSAECSQMAGRSNWTSCRVSGPVSRYWSQLSQYTGPKHATYLDWGREEVARVSVVSLKVDLANVVFNHIVGNLQAQPKLCALLVEQPGTDSVLLRHPSGQARRNQGRCRAPAQEPASLPAGRPDASLSSPVCSGPEDESSTTKIPEPQSLPDSSRCPDCVNLNHPARASTGPAYLLPSNTGVSKAWARSRWSRRPLGNEPESSGRQALPEAKETTLTFTARTVRRSSQCRGRYYTAEEVARCMRPAGPLRWRDRGRLLCCNGPGIRAVMAGPCPFSRDGNRLVVDLPAVAGASQSDL